MPPLKNIKYERWCQVYWLTQSATKADRAVGYASHGNASRFLKRGDVQRRLAELTTIDLGEAVAEKQEALKWHTGVMRVPYGEEDVSISDRRESAKELARLDNWYPLEKQPAVSDNRVVNIYVMSDKAKELTENIGRRLQNRLGPPEEEE